LLKADHREVEALFDRFETSSGDAEKGELAAIIFLGLKVHAQIEEQLFYPPARAESGDADLADEALVEHRGAKILIAQIEATKPANAKVHFTQTDGTQPPTDPKSSSWLRGHRSYRALN
jgi:hemerythrin superfamily protein